MSGFRECPECLALYRPSYSEQICCTRRCARMRDARKGEPSIAEKKIRFADAMLKAFDEIFRLK